MPYYFKSSKCKVLEQPDVKDTLHKLHANYVLVPADKAANNVIIVCKKYHIDTLVKELGINNININNPTYIPIDDSFETIVKSHNQFITSVGSGNWKCLRKIKICHICTGHPSSINHHTNIGIYIAGSRVTTSSSHQWELEMSEEDQNLPYPKFHKSPYKHRYIAGSTKCMTKDLSCLSW